ncbi:arp10p [Saccharomyces arboricola H-6]|uniref:Arp10p n=1 Tax=Saccharomyces arboricola (strain H-6 / AS 2.3317 / CBS 10644) TaxID=1160507 RepID=J8Q6H2_SACAR|nr:arp10p [Saccharomyces arboricola H-6]
MSSTMVTVCLGASNIEIGRSDLACPQEIIAWETGNINEGNRKELKEIFERYFKTYDCSPSQEVGALILEDIFISVIEKKIICGILLEELGCAHVSFIPRVIIHCLSCDTMNALVIDVGATCTTCVPIFDLRPLQKYIRYTKRGKRQFVSDVSPLSCPYLPVFFEDNQNSKIHDDDEIPVTNLVKYIVDLLPIDLRKPLRENVILVNVEKKYETEVTDLFKETMDTSNIRLSDSYWRGGSIYARALLHNKGDNVLGIKRDEFYNNPHTAPDWLDFYFRSVAKCIK